MAEIKIVQKEPLTLSELADTLKKLGKDLDAIQQKVKDFAIKFSKLNKTEEAKIVDAIKKLGIPRLDEKYIALIVNLMPKNITELRTIFAGSPTNLTEENLQKIMDILKQYAK